MQDFLSGDAFEQMAREYNAKYNKTNILESANLNNLNLQNLNEFEVASNSNNNLNLKTKDKEKEILQIKKDFEEISSLFLFLKTYIKKTNNIGSCQEFVSKKLTEIESKLKNLTQKL